jgi:hypothetical protein
LSSTTLIRIVLRLDSSNLQLSFSRYLFF